MEQSGVENILIESLIVEIPANLLDFTLVVRITT